MVEKKLCPVCGSDRLESVVSKETIHGDMGKELILDRTHERCLECDSEGDFFNENEKITENALSALNETYIDEVLNFFDEKKISYAGIERAVGLPQRTLTKWKSRNSTPTSAGIALLKYLRTFPWLIEVAENKFDFNIAQKIFIGAALNTFVNSISFSGSDLEKTGYSVTLEKSKSQKLFKN
jgi:DNA-binding transcriptional regulator YiaG